MSHFIQGLQDELNKQASLGLLLTPVKNLAAHAIMNTNVAPPLRKMFKAIGDDFLGTGFRHGLVGKRVSPLASTPIAAVDGGASYFMYNQGWEVGDKIRRGIGKIPKLPTSAPLQAVSTADDVAKYTTKLAPFLGAAGGAGYGYFTAKTKKEPVPVKAIIANALVGALLGKGVQHFAPQAPVVKQLSQVREHIVEPSLKGSNTPIGKILDAIAGKSPIPK